MWEYYKVKGVKRMSIKRFRKLSRLLESVFKTMSIMFGIEIIILVFGLLTGNTKEVIELMNVKVDGFSLFNLTKGTIENNLNYLALSLSAIVGIGIKAYVCYQGGIFFSILKTNKQPFSQKVYLILKKIGLLLIIGDLLAPLIYYIVLTITMTSGYHFSLITWTYQSIIGLVIYYMAEVIRYGVTLQKFSNDVV